MDKPHTNTEVAYKLARMVYFMLTRGDKYAAASTHYQYSQAMRCSPRPPLHPSGRAGI